MRALVLFALVLTAIGIAPEATAHQCATSSPSGDCVCPAPNDGQAHQHANSRGSCQAAAGFSQSATPGGASQTPGFGLLTAAVGVGVAALVLSRR